MGNAKQNYEPKDVLFDAPRREEPVLSMRWPASIAFWTFFTFATSAVAQERGVINVVSYQPPVGLIEYLNKRAPERVVFNQSDWVSVSEADILLYFMSPFEARHEIPQFGSEILDTTEYAADETALTTQSINYGDRTILAVFVSADQLDRSRDQIMCNTANAVSLFAAEYYGGGKVDLQNC